MSLLRLSTPSEPTLQASKWQKCQVLLDPIEMQELLAYLGDVHLFLCSGIWQKGKESLSTADFTKKYQEYIQELQKGQIPDANTYRPYFSAFLTATPDALFAIPIDHDKLLVRASQPIIQMQMLHFHYSNIDNSFHAGVFGKDSVNWGIQFSYPQLYQDNETKDVDMVRNSSKFPNSHLFQQMQKWMREHTIPTPFLAQDKLINSPIRIGKNCLSWINSHPQLQAEGLAVRSSL